MVKLNIQLFADGKVTIETDLNNDGFKNGLSKMQSIAKTGFKAIGTSVGVASTAIAGLIGKSVTMAGDLEQQMGGTEAVFGDFANTVQNKAAAAFDQMGISANDFMATANKMGALMQGSGLDIETSMELSTQAMQRAADVASIMGIDVNAAMESVAGAAKGNFTMMDNLGVAMNATTIEAYALSKGIDTSFNEMDNATKVGLAMEMFLEKTAYAAGNYAKENKTFAGSFNTLKAATSNFLSGAGGIEEVADALVGFGEILVESIGNMAPSIVEGLTNLTTTLIPQIPVLLETLMPTVLEGAMALINGLIVIFPALIQMIQQNLPSIVQGGMQIVTTLINTILNMLPDILKMGISLVVELAKGIVQQLPQLIPVAIDTIFVLVDTLLDNIDLIIDAGIELVMALAEGLIDALPELIDKIPIIIEKLLMALSNNLPKLLQMGMKLSVEIAKGLIKSIPSILAFIPQMFTSLLASAANYFLNMINLGKNIVNKLVEGFSNIKDVGKNLIQGLWEGIQEKWNNLKKNVEKLGNGIVNKFKEVFGIHSPSRVMRDEVGKYLAQGVGVGFDGELDSVYKDMQRAIDLETSKMSANVQASGTYQMAIAGLPTFNLVDNTENTTQLVVNGKVLAEVVNTENRNREVAVA